MASMSTQGALSLSSSSPSSSSSRQWTYDVFLSFRGEDTRNGFTDHLFAALKWKGILTFRDNERLEKGKSISPELLKAIEESRFAIVIVSRNYASSTWCLDELAKIIRCMHDMEMTVLPIFYNVDPSNIRRQTGTFAQAFAKHEERLKEDNEKVQTWRAALSEVANLSGWHSHDRSEAEVIEDIVKVILNKLSYTLSADTKRLVGITSRVEKLMSQIAIKSKDVHIIGIRGTGGMGKTTLAKVVYDMISNQFEDCSFIANVREVFEKYGLFQLQQTLLNEVLGHKDMNVQDVDSGVSMIKNRLCCKKILLVLDDVNELEQLNKLVGERDWFGQGSRVIITTRDLHLLRTHKVDAIYEVEGLNYDEAFHLFNLKAFGKENPTEDYLELSQAFVHYADGLPLAIEVLGSFLFNRSIHEWKSELERLKEFPERKILNVLQISFDGLQETEKEIFLNIACFFNQKNRESIIKILDYLDLYPKIGLRVLIDKSLVKVHDKQLWMHDLLQEMGRDIVRQECPKDPGKRSRLWLYKDIDNVLTKNMGTEAIQGIVLKLPHPTEVDWNPESFSKIHCLKFLIIDNVIHDPKHLPCDLRFLDWSGYHSKSLPSSFQPNELIELHINCSNIVRLWKGTKSFDMLKFIQLKKSLKLIEAPDISKIPNLEKLVLKDCINLLELHPSIGVHKKLTLLNLKGCKNLRSISSKFEMESLEILILSDCSKVKRIPEFGENMEHVVKLNLDDTAITKLPTSIGNLTGLASLSVRDCKNLISLPSTFFNMKSLENFNLSGCSKLFELLENFGTNAPFQTLKKLVSSGFKARSPGSMSLLSTSLLGLCSLTNLDLSYCNLKVIPDDVCCLFSLKILNISGNNFGCLPESIAQLYNLRQLCVENCKNLQSLPKPPRNICNIWGYDCTSLETVPDLLKLNSLGWSALLLSNCSKLADKKGFIDMFFAVIRKHLQGHFLENRYDIVIPGSKIPKWFRHQSIGTEVSIKEPHSLLWNECMGIAVCVVFCSHSHLQIHEYCLLTCMLIANGKEMPLEPHTSKIFPLSDHIWLIYLLPKYYQKKDIKFLWECDANGFSQIGVRIKTYKKNFDSPLSELIPGWVKKCGLRMVYKKDITTSLLMRA